MKRILSLIVFVLSFCVVNAQEKDYYYSSYFHEKLSITASNEGVLRLYIQVFGERYDDFVLFFIEGEHNIQAFSDALKLSKEKFVEWSRVASENRVRNFDKNMDIVFPYVTICWEGLKWWLDVDTRLNPRFVVTGSGECVFVISGTATAFQNEYIDQVYSFALSSESDFDRLIRNIEIDNLMSDFNERDNIDTLFK